MLSNQSKQLLEALESGRQHKSKHNIPIIADGYTSHRSINSKRNESFSPSPESSHIQPDVNALGRH